MALGKPGVWVLGSLQQPCLGSRCQEAGRSGQKGVRVRVTYGTLGGSYSKIKEKLGDFRTDPGPLKLRCESVITSPP